MIQNIISSIRRFTKRSIILVTVFLLAEVACAQQANISGTLIDASTAAPLPYANVFLNNTTIGTVTNAVGKFSIKNAPSPAVYEVILSYVGYESFKQKISVTDKPVALGVVKLKPLSVELNSIVVKSSRDKEWEKEFKKFRKIFLGEDKVADLCEILNPWGIEFKEEGKRFTAHAVSPLEIENRALGYRVYFTLTHFQSAKAEYTIEGHSRFEELESFNTNEQVKWLANREKAYLTSRQHLFKAMIEKKIKGEGFELYTEKEGFSATTRTPVFATNVGTTIEPYDTTNLVVSTSQQGIYKINLKGRMEIHYTFGETYARVYKDIAYPVSWLWPNKKFILVNKEGVELNPLDVSISGDMSRYRVANMMPLNFIPKPATNKQLKKEILVEVPLEKIYLHTDKPYYYPGEIIWFKGYVNYNLPNLQDSLSKTVYVELIDREWKRAVISKILPIDSASFSGELTLPDSLKPKNYFIRAYTQWNRNFQEENFFYRPLPVLKLMETIDVSAERKQSIFLSDILSIHTEKAVYKPREKIYLILKLKNQANENLLSNLSVSVVDDNQVVPLQTPSITHSWEIKQAKEIRKPSYIYPIEYGIDFSGKFLGNNSSPTKATLNVVQLNPHNFTITESDDNGNFYVRGLQFSDSSDFTIQASNKKGELYGKAELRKRSVAPINFMPANNPFKVISTPTVMRSKSIFDVDEAQLLKEVVIKDTKEEPLENRRPYGKSQYVLTRKDINTNYPNLLFALQGKFPGLIIREGNNTGSDGASWLVYTTRAATSSIFNAKEVTVLVNDVFVGGSPASILTSINPEDVASVELKTGLSALYGASGASGVLSIYTNKAPEMTPKKNIQTIRIAGYSSSKKFKLPDFSSSGTDAYNKNHSSLVYWNPAIRTNAEGDAVASFFAADQPTRYRVIVEGVTLTNEPVHSEYLIEVKGN